MLFPDLLGFCLGLEPGDLSLMPMSLMAVGLSEPELRWPMDMAGRSGIGFTSGGYCDSILQAVEVMVALMVSPGAYVLVRRADSKESGVWSSPNVMIRVVEVMVVGVELWGVVLPELDLRERRAFTAISWFS